MSGLVKRVKTMFNNHGITLYFSCEEVLYIKKDKCNLSCVWNARKPRATWFSELPGLEYSGAALTDLCAPTLLPAYSSQLIMPVKRRPPAEGRVPVLPTVTLFIYLHFCFSHRMWIPRGQRDCLIHLFVPRASNSNLHIATS